jgi:hypothetical protein
MPATFPQMYNAGICGKTHRHFYTSPNNIQKCASELSLIKKEMN